MTSDHDSKDPAAAPAPVSNFITDFIDEHNRSGRFQKRVHTRFPPEPNGYLHIGHAKAICLNFSIAAQYGGKCNLRFDDSNPSTEDQEYVDSIMRDIKWLGFDWQDRLFFASDYFEQTYQYAVQLIKKGKAYVCDLTPEQMREHRGTLTEPGRESPGRKRTIEENLDLFTRMRAGEFPDGAYTLRAAIDMAAPNINMRDPAMYRIKRAQHHRTGDAWCIYPMYDYIHCVSDSIEGITHSLCSLEFEDHRPLYDWFLDELGAYRPQQIEFARLNITFTVLSKRKLLQMVQEKVVSGWDDPRMPTLSGLRRRGYTPAAIRNFCEKIGVAKANSTVDVGLLEFCLREDLNRSAPRAMAVLRPLKVIIDNYPEGQVEEIECENNPEDPAAGTRKVPFSRELYIERDDFREDPPKKYYRLSPGREVRLKHAYYITCKNVVKDGDGTITELHCSYDPESRGGGTPDGRTVKGTLHWVSAAHARQAEVRLYDHLFSKTNPEESEAGENFLSNINPNSLEVLSDCWVEPALAQAEPGSHFQFLRLGYFTADSQDHSSSKLVFNRSVTLRDSWAKIEKKGA
ncbi:MAG: glutamine--tRNA ligase/YqeY domain fusion protein [Deltaproteobacteria bacterium]|nr:glutamine--tRNA ligase/YqeY domain fusion protein [Deltaproteobacteria bacterium]